ncbi:MAG: Asp23/Gls24 family envelope stress response protein [Nitrospirota bacterium]|nr:Asp23/Gls24 family envelope stress response protein [Nitrospirota bacterium]
MDKEESRTDLGTIRIYKNVIASIAAIAALEIDGVKKVGGNLKTSILEFIEKKPVYAVNVELDKAGEAKIDIPIIIKYDCNIPETANKVQENVRSALERMTSLSIKEININVQAIERG